MIVIKSGRHPLAVTLLVFCAVSGTANLLAFNRSASTTARMFPGVLGQVYFAVLAVGSVVALAGIYMPGLTGPIVERAGLTMLTGLFLGYALLAFVAAGWRALFVAALLLGFGLGCALRAFQIRRELRVVRAAAEQVGAMDQLGGPRERGRHYRAGRGWRERARQLGDAADGGGAAPEADRRGGEESG